LKYLQIGFNPISSIDLSANTLLTDVRCRNANFSAEALNNMFRSLHGNSGEKFIDYYGNPGTASCDASIVTGKGWTVRF
jgi:hypothetical protein